MYDTAVDECAHLTVGQDIHGSEDGSVTQCWHCQDCGLDFVPGDVAEFWQAQCDAMSLVAKHLFESRQHIIGAASLLAAGLVGMIIGRRV